MNKVQKFSLLCGAVSSMLDGGKSELSDMLGVRLDHLSKMLNGKKGITDQRLARMEEIASKVLPPGFGFQDHVVTDLSEIWDRKTIMALETAAKLRGMTPQEYVLHVSRKDIKRDLLEDSPNLDESNQKQNQSDLSDDNNHLE